MASAMAASRGDSDDEEDAAEQPVEHALDEHAAAARGGPLQVQQRQAGDRPDGQPRAGDLDDPRRHDEVDPALVERPGQPAQGVPRQVGVRGHRDDVGPQVVDHAQDAPRVGVRTGDHVGRQRHLATADAHADGGEPVPRFTVELLDNVAHRGPLPDHDDPVHPVARKAAAVEPGPQSAPSQQGEDEGERNESDDEGAGQAALEGEGCDRHHDEEHQGGVREIPVLLGARTEESVLVTASGGDRQEPQHRCEHAHGDVGGPRVGSETEQGGAGRRDGPGEQVEAHRERAVAAQDGRRAPAGCRPGRDGRCRARAGGGGQGDGQIRPPGRFRLGDHACTSTSRRQRPNRRTAPDRHVHVSVPRVVLIPGSDAWWAGSRRRPSTAPSAAALARAAGSDGGLRAASGEAAAPTAFMRRRTSTMAISHAPELTSARGSGCPKGKRNASSATTAPAVQSLSVNTERSAGG